MLVISSSPSSFSFKPGKTCGVYFLKLRGKIVYIGKSTNVFSRIYSNHIVDKEFDEVEIHWVPKERITGYELQQIALHKPPLNDYDGSKRRENTRQRYAKR